MDVDYIKQSVTMADVLHRYGFLAPDKDRGRIPCPLHNGHDKNFSYKARSFKCFVCNESGDVIAFTMKLFGDSFPDACKRLNRDFCLGLTDEKPTKEARLKTLELRRAREAEAERCRREENAAIRAEREQIDYWRQRVEQTQPFVLRGIPFWPPGREDALAKLEYLECLRDDAVSEEYFAACQRKWYENHESKQFAELAAPSSNAS